MEHACYVIMPYGKNGSKKEKKYSAIFENIIKRAAVEAGYEPEKVIREDRQKPNKVIMESVVENIANCEVIIADISEPNANVYYELGVAHTFHKSSTILICRKGSKFPFDIKGLGVVEYTTKFTDELSICIRAITQAIKQQKTAPYKPDNFVHSSVKELPYHLIEYILAGRKPIEYEKKGLNIRKEDSNFLSFNTDEYSYCVDDVGGNDTYNYKEKSSFESD